MAGRFVCFQCGDEYPEKADLRDHWDAEGHGPEDVARLGIARARGEVPSEVTTEGEARRSARRRVNDLVAHRRRPLRLIDGGKR